MTDQNATPTTEPTGPISVPSPASAVRVARIGGTIAEIAAAAISAHTLYNLGGQLDLGPAAAWLLPAALDVYAFTALAVGYNLPANHPAQRAVLRNARLAFTMTLACNALDHLLRKAGRLIDPTARDLLLVSVATLPPLVVERLLNLQSLLGGNRGEVPSRTSARDSQPAVVERPLGQAIFAHDPVSAASSAVDGAPRIESADPAGRPVSPPSARPDWAVLGAEIFADLSARLGRRPSGREFQAALAMHTKALIADRRLASGVRPPSVSSAKRIRAALESTQMPDCDQSLGRPSGKRLEASDPPESRLDVG